MPSQPPFEEIGEKSFPELAEAIRSQSEQIIRIWIGEIRQIMPTLKGLADIELRDNMPNIMSALADYVSSINGARKLAAESPAQGMSRFRQNYDMRGLMQEDRIFRRIAIQQAEAKLKRRMTQEEQIALDTGIDLMLQQAVVAFADHQTNRIRESTENELKYLSFLSHDLNNHLGSVTLFLQVLRQRLADLPEFAQDVATLDRTQESILNTIGGMGRLLQNERLRKTGITVKSVQVNLHRLCSSVAQQAMSQAEKKGLVLSVDVPADATVVSDGEMIALALQNILGNAVKYSSRGEVRISARQLGKSKPAQWEISISDEGPGIAQEHVERIFEAFRRGESHGQTGVGLGLAIASQAAKLLGAEVSVDSTIGVGSIFRLALRAKEQPGPLGRKNSGLALGDSD